MKLRLLKPEVEPEEGIIARIWTWLVYRVSGRRLIDCTKCEGSGRQLYVNDRLGVRSSVCVRCSGTGMVWR